MKPLIAPTPNLLTMWCATIDAIYREELGRQADPGGMAAHLWAAMMGQQEPQLRAFVRASAEWQQAHAAPVVPPKPSWTLPTRAEVLANLRADICMRADGDTRDYTGMGTWESLSWDDARWNAFALAYKAAGNRLLPCSMVVSNYLGADFDYTQDIATLIQRLDRAHASGLIPMLALNCVDAPSRGAETLARLPMILRQIKGHVAAVFTGWEIDVTADAASLYTYNEHLRVIELARDILGPEAVIGIEFNTIDSRNEPVTFDGRDCRDAQDYWTRTSARLADVFLLRLPYSIVKAPTVVVDEVGGALYRIQGAFEHPTRWPDGSEIPASVKANWRNDYESHKKVVLFEYASYLRWPSSQKRALRQYVQSVLPMLSGYGEG